MVDLFISQQLTAYTLLGLVLSEQYHISPLPDRLRTETGKPYFATGCNLHFNISHSGGYALCGVGDEPLGVDIEVIHPRGVGLPRYALTIDEYQAFLMAGGGWDDFYFLWTRREAWSKYTGAGIARSKGLEIPAHLQVCSFAGDGWRAAACATREIGLLHWR